MSAPSSPAPRTRFVVLGASNVARALPRVVDTARAAVGARKTVDRDTLGTIVDGLLETYRSQTLLVG